MFLSKSSCICQYTEKAPRLIELVVWIAKHCKDGTGALLGIVASVLDAWDDPVWKTHVRGNRAGEHRTENALHVLQLVYFPFRYRQESKQTLSKYIKSQNPKFQGMIVSPFSMSKEKKKDYPHPKLLHGY